MGGILGLFYFDVCSNFSIIKINIKERYIRSSSLLNTLFGSLVT